MPLAELVRLFEQHSCPESDSCGGGVVYGWDRVLIMLETVIRYK
jgi:hypothetical protein